jgi:multidrug efflux pump subunit AcrB
MPPQQIESDITDSYERFFTLASNIDHIQSRSISGVSLIKIYFQPGTDANAAVSNISNLAMANLRRLPPGTLPPVVLSFDASNLPVCLITLKGEGLNQTQLKDIAQFSVRNQVAGVPGASVPQPYGGRYRQIMVYVDPIKLQAAQMSLMDVVHAINDSNLILPAGDVRIGTRDYNIYPNAQVEHPEDVNDIPLKTVGTSTILVGDIGHAEDAGQLQTNIVRVDGQHSVYIPIFKQGGGSNTITIVNGVRAAIKHLLDVPPQLKTAVVFDQSLFVKLAVHNVLTEGGIGLLLTAIMILLFLGSFRATVAVLLSIPISCLATFLVLNAGGSSINTMVLGGLALALSRLIDNSVVVLENIFRHREMGEDSVTASAVGGREVQLAVLAATVTTSIVFFPVMLLTGVSKYLFSALGIAVVIAMFSSFVVAMTVVPAYCAIFIGKISHPTHGEEAAQDAALIAERDRRFAPPILFRDLVARFNAVFARVQARYESALLWSLARPGTVVAWLCAVIVLVLLLFPLLGRAFFPRTDPGQFVISVKAPPGTRIEVTDRYVARIEDDIRSVVKPADLNMIVSNIGIAPDLSAIYTSNSAMDTAFIQVSLKEHHDIGSYVYMSRMRKKLADDLPQVQTFFNAGGLIDSVVDQGQPAPIDVQISGNDLEQSYALAQSLARQLGGLKGVSDVLVPQDLDYPGLALNIDRVKASIAGLTPKAVVDNVITALTSNGMIEPSYWIDPKTGNDYMLTVQYPETQIKTLGEFREIPLRSPDGKTTTPLESVASLTQINTPTEVDHYQLRRIFDIYVMPKSEDLSRTAARVQHVIDHTKAPAGVLITMRGTILYMRSSFKSFGIGLALAVVLVFLVLMAQFASFSDPFIILLAIPPGISGAVLCLFLTGTTINVMSLMGVLMMAGIATSDSILIVEFIGKLRKQGVPFMEAIIEGSRVRLRPILMTTLATLLGIIPMALAIEPGSEQYAPLARAMFGGLCVSGLITVFLVPCTYLLIHRKRVAAEEAH